MRTTQALAVLLLILSGVAGAMAQTLDTASSEAEMEEIVVTDRYLEEWTKEDILGFMEEAKEVLSTRTLTPHEYIPYTKTRWVRGKRQVIRMGYDVPSGRPVLYAAWSKRERRWHVIEIELPCPQQNNCWHGDWHKGKPPIVPTWVTPGYTATHVRGSGHLHLMFSFTYMGERLYVFGWKYPNLDRAKMKARKPNWRSIIEQAEVTTDLPDTNDARHPDFIVDGRQDVAELVQRAQSRLREMKVMSRAYPGELVADVIPAFLPETIPLIEQADSEWPVESEIDRVLHRIGMSGADAFARSTSHKDARGLVQYTRPTYVSIVRKYPTAGLTHDFASGVQDPLNAMMAAICLLDYELASRPKEVREHFRANPGALGVYLVVAYNAGPSVRRAFHRFVLQATKNHLERLREPPTLEDALDPRCPCVYVEEEDGVVRLAPLPPPSRYNRESRGYVWKYYYTKLKEHPNE